MDCPYTPNFLVVNLSAQSDAVSAFVRGWPEEHILAWLSRQGELVKHSGGSGEEFYSFRSRMGFADRFSLEGDQFTFIVDSSAWKSE